MREEVRQSMESQVIRCFQRLVTSSCLALLSIAPVGAQQATKGRQLESGGANRSVEELKSLQWIAGTWLLEVNGRITEEHWRPLRGSMLLGTSHTFDTRKTYFFEHLRIAVVNGELVYEALPGGSNATTFTKTKIEESFVEFENAEHDYPQRIRYERTDIGFTATISLLDGSKARHFIFKKRQLEND